MTPTYHELERQWQQQAPGPRAHGKLHLIVTRASAAAVPRGHDKKLRPLHQQPSRVRFTCLQGVEGDRWKLGMDMESQISLTSVRVTELIARDRARWHLVGNNFVVDLDLSLESLPVGTRLSLGTGQIEISAKPHEPCDRYAARFGQGAFDWAGDPAHAERCLRGRYARIIRDGEAAIDDEIHVLGC